MLAGSAKVLHVDPPFVEKRPTTALVVLSTSTSFEALTGSRASCGLNPEPRLRWPVTTAGGSTASSVRSSSVSSRGRTVFRLFFLTVLFECGGKSERNQRVQGRSAIEDSQG